MLNSIIKPGYFGALLILIAVILSISPARADQIFSFSEDLSSNYRLDTAQTSAKISGGMAFTADDSVSSSVTSAVIANSSKAIISARLDVSDNTPSNARLVYFISNNNGQRWMQVNAGYTYLFDSVGGQLRWKAIIARDSVHVASARIDSISLSYTVSDTLSVNQNNIYSSSGYNNSDTLSYGNDPNSLVCNTLSLVGLGCGKSSPSTYVRSSSTILPPPATGSGVAGNNSNNSSGNGNGDNSNLNATVYNAGTKNTNGNGTDIILVRIPKHDEVYEIIGGKKHLIPTMDIFYSYGFTDSMIQPITQQQLDKYPRVKVIQVKGDKKKNYYLTEGYMVRLVPHKKISESYGDREEDIVVISKKEFNYYPPDQFVFLERPLRRDVFQVVNGSKRFVTPMAVKRMNIKDTEIAPINETDLSYYKTGSPIVF
jgi:hypothetical protein